MIKHGRGKIASQAASNAALRADVCKNYNIYRGRRLAGLKNKYGQVRIAWVLKTDAFAYIWGVWRYVPFEHESIHKLPGANSDISLDLDAL